MTTEPVKPSAETVQDVALRSTFERWWDATYKRMKSEAGETLYSRDSWDAYKAGADFVYSGFKRECCDVDEIIAKLGLTTEQARTEGGVLRVQRILNHIQETLDALADASNRATDFANKYIAARDSSAPAQQGDNVGHGHVYPRPDGVKARCGGPAICKECALDFARKNAEQPKAQPSSAEVVAWVRVCDGHSGPVAVEFEVGPTMPAAKASGVWRPLYFCPPSAVPIPELQAMCERWDTYGAVDATLRICADELRALIDQHDKVK